MNTILRNLLAIVAGVVIGSIVNMMFITISSSIIPPPDGADVTTTEGLKASMHMFEPKHFVFPFLAHAIGTLVGACITTWLVKGQKLSFAFIIAVFFLAGGVASVFMLPSPMWYTILDLTIAYIPMAYLGGKLGLRLKLQSNHS